METNRTIRAIDLTKEFDEFEELSVISFGSGANPNQSMYRWLFDEDPYDPASGNLMFVMRDMDAGGKMIASDGLIPFDLQLGSRTVRAAHSVKSMTHPDYKRQGIFRTMTQNSLDRGKENGVQLVLGFANKNSYPAYQKFGWTTIFPREVYVFPSDISRKVAAKTKSKLLGKLGNIAFRIVSDAKRAGLHAAKRFTVQNFDKVPPEAAQLWEKYKDKYENLIVRDATYLHWRYDERPDRSYETLLLSGEEGPVGYLILRQSVLRLRDQALDAIAQRAVAEIRLCENEEDRARDREQREHEHPCQLGGGIHAVVEEIDDDHDAEQKLEHRIIRDDLPEPCEQCGKDEDLQRE